MIQLRIRRFGKSLGVVLPQEVIQRLRTRLGDCAFLSEIENRDYRLTSNDPLFKRKMAKAKEIMGRYRNTLCALAK